MNSNCHVDIWIYGRIVRVNAITWERILDKIGIGINNFNDFRIDTRIHGRIDARIDARIHDRIEARIRRDP